MMNKLTFSTLVASVMLLTACGGNDNYINQVKTHALPTPIPTPAPNPTPVPTPTPIDKSVFTLQDMTPDLSNQDQEMVSYTVQIGNQDDDKLTYQDGKSINLADLKKGFTATTMTETLVTKDKTTNAQNPAKTTTGDLYLFKQDYSALAIYNPFVDAKTGVAAPIFDGHQALKGVPTETLPTSGVFKYEGIAHLSSQNNSLNPPSHIHGATIYQIDFDKKLGSGSIISIDGKHAIELEQAGITLNKEKHYNGLDNSELSIYKITGNASHEDSTGTYGLGIFGTNAEEILGTVDIQGDSPIVGIFGGKKQ